MRQVKRLALIWAGMFSISFLIGVPMEWLTDDTRTVEFTMWIVLALCGSVVAAHSTGPIALLTAPATVVVAVFGVYLGGYLPYGLHIGDLEPSDYGCCDMGTGVEGLWNRIWLLSFLGTFVGAFIGFVVWLVEGLPGAWRYVDPETKERGLDGTLRR